MHQLAKGYTDAQLEQIAGYFEPAKFPAILFALLLATTFTVWNQSVVNEKVYTISLFFFTAVSWLMISWTNDPEGPQAERRLVLVG